MGCAGPGLKRAAPRLSRPRSTVGAPPPRARSSMHASAAPTIARARSVASASGVVAALRCARAAPACCSAVAGSRTTSTVTAPRPRGAPQPEQLPRLEHVAVGRALRNAARRRVGHGRLERSGRRNACAGGSRCGGGGVVVVGGGGARGRCVAHLGEEQQVSDHPAGEQRPDRSQRAAAALSGMHAALPPSPSSLASLSSPPLASSPRRQPQG